jgi:phospholipid N-methyltransferase
MPDLNTTLHLDALRQFRSKRANILVRIARAVKREFTGEVYGLAWGDPENAAPLKFIRDRYVTPYVKPEEIGLEIGPGGGRWTRYLLGFRKLYVVDYYAEILEELKRTYNPRNLEFIKNGGTDFPGVENGSIDYLFSFATFVHLDLPLIDAYLANMRRILKPAANVMIHYSDMTKIMARHNVGFSDNTPEIMRNMVRNAGYKIVEEDLTTMWHSSIIHFRPSVTWQSNSTLFRL